MDGKKTYSIVINGVKESIDAVEALNKQLDALEARMKELEKSASVSVKTKGTSNAGILDEEAAIQREINKLKQEGANLDAKIAASQDEVYKKVDATKQLYKEVIADQKAIAAQERLVADEYSNTMQGMKSKLADLKAVINTTDLGDSESIKKMTQEANELTNKLKEMEQAYGQFGRNVGNYKSAADGFKGLSIVVAGTTQEFDNARQALKTLQGELRTLQVKKDQGLFLSEDEVKRFQELPSIVAQLKSSIQDAGKPMDGLMDTMQSIVAIAQTSKGISAFFGIEDSGVEETIKNLVALQNAMQGLQTIQKQLQSQEGLGKWLAKGNAAIDTFTKKLFGVEKAANTTNAAIASTGTAGKTAATGLGTASVAANTATKSFSLATAAATALKVVLSALGIGLVIAAISALVDGIGHLIDKQKEAKKFQEDLNNAIQDGQKEYAKTTVELSQLKSRLDNFNGSKKQEKKLVEELNSKYGDALGQYKSLKEWKDALIKKGESYAKVLKLEAENQALLNLYTENFIKLMHAKDLAQKGPDFWDEAAEWLPWNWGGKSAQDKLDDTVKQIDAAGDEILKRIEANNKEIEKLNKENEIFDYAPTIDKNADKTKKALDEKYRTMNQLELRLMKEGLNKKLRQLDEEERQTINKLKENGRLTSDEMKKIQRAFSQLREKEIKEYLKNLEDSIKKSAKEIEKIQFEINTTEIDNQINELQNKFDVLSQKAPRVNTLTSRIDLKNIYSTTNVSDVLDARMFNAAQNWAYDKGEYDLYYEILENYLKDKNEEIKNEFLNIKITQGDKAAFNWLTELYEEEYREAINIVRSYGDDVMVLFQDQLETENDWLSWSFNTRLNAVQNYYDKVLSIMADNLEEQGKLNDKRIKEQIKQDKQAEVDRYNIQYEALQKQKENTEETIKNFKARNDKEVKQLEQLKKDRDDIQKLQEAALLQHWYNLGQITEEGNNAIKKNEIDTQNAIKSSYEKYFDTQLSNYRDFQSKLNDEISRNPVTSKGWGIVNITETKKNYKEIIAASDYAIKAIQSDKANLEDAMRNGLISDEAYNATKNNLNDLEKEIKQGMAVTQEASKNIVADFVSSIQMYLQEVLNSFSTIMNAVWDAEDIAFDKEQEQLDKENELLEQKLDKQQEIIERHKSAIDSIEDELATSRGDRRQHLIDQLNAEMEAQRAAAAEEKRIQKEKEANQKKQDELELKRKKAEYHRSMLQAIVNGAMAVTMAAINSWPIPAIPMMALAASTTAAQVAIMAANKPYAKGGQLEGKSHAEGGIKVAGIGNGIELEGKEYVIRKKSTEPNLGLLDFINRSEKKLSIDDFIDFYTSGKIKKNISSMSPRAKFADGGVIPTLTNDYQFDDRLLSAFEDYANRPYVVSVVDINSRQAAVKNVQVLAGLGD